MPTIVGILTFMSGENSILGLSGPKKADFLDIFILMSILNFMLNWVEHEIQNAHKYKYKYKKFYNLGARLGVHHTLQWLL